MTWQAVLAAANTGPNRKALRFNIPARLDPRQLAELRSRPRRGQTEIERWFEIWDALFPGVDRPGSPYISTPEDEILHIARQGLERICPPDTSSQVLEQVLNRLNWSAVSSAFDNSSSGKTEHIYRRHSLKSFCGRCYEHFEESEALKRHQRAEIPCQVRAPVSAITEEQDKLLHARAKAHCSEETKWEEMYRIIFPGEKVPSPYYDANPSAAPKPDPARLQSEDECRDFLRTELPRLVRPAMEQYVAGLLEEVQKNVQRKTDEIIHDVKTKVLYTFQLQGEQSSLSALPASRLRPGDVQAGGSAGGIDA
ncbi:hypothetical protein NEMBOFW57_007888 [Staphylotrichum longicolle]|uniref:C2H2-type domain-containing protein n=1 Tax=Staphylotrichum longicolle TaxID=669026 RepID=A0AAD4EVQ3_9PEZI|nr:hypothetical protein NEMBOFW57_007888 [Staphylotrichum longicolle]